MVTPTPTATAELAGAGSPGVVGDVVWTGVSNGASCGGTGIDGDSSSSPGSASSSGGLGGRGSGSEETVGACDGDSALLWSGDVVGTNEFSPGTDCALLVVVAESSRTSTTSVTSQPIVPIVCIPLQALLTKDKSCPSTWSPVSRDTKISRWSNRMCLCSRARPSLRARQKKTLLQPFFSGASQIKFRDIRTGAANPT